MKTTPHPGVPSFKHRATTCSKPNHEPQQPAIHSLAVHQRQKSRTTDMAGAINLQLGLNYHRISQLPRTTNGPTLSLISDRDAEFAGKNTWNPPDSCKLSFAGSDDTSSACVSGTRIRVHETRQLSSKWHSPVQSFKVAILFACDRTQ